MQINKIVCDYCGEKTTDEEQSRYYTLSGPDNVLVENIDCVTNEVIAIRISKTTSEKGESCRNGYYKQDYMDTCYGCLKDKLNETLTIIEKKLKDKTCKK